jgi:hypothetical protein
VVRLRAGEGERSPEVRYDGPFDFERGRLDLDVPVRPSETPPR